MEERRTMPVQPPWLERLLSTAFFTVCETHGGSGSTRSERNMFCLDCPSGEAFCHYCRASKPKDHRVIQIRRSSYHDVVRVSEVQKALDISGVQTYVINSARVLFLNERPQIKASKSVGHICQICSRSLLEAFKFCSLGCKLVAVKRNDNESFAVGGNNYEEGMNRKGFGLGDQVLREASQQGMYPAAPSPPSSTRRRKGIPHRAPLWS